LNSRVKLHRVRLSAISLSWVPGFVSKPSSLRGKSRLRRAGARNLRGDM
jgi:hypothetical protein